ncbi:hypothetical protein Pmani_033958 [Petrolisthes manimaculis]|uniref:Uncharacterized protein n=1 Tax=Petrolisthes manimaculis TaxID=1843537 RepID=A0AAE1NNI3_9EUCA|nr:hypothetical protein Pmani_033958 [Petrolisthes manimaculis]
MGDVGIVEGKKKKEEESRTRKEKTEKRAQKNTPSQKAKDKQRNSMVDDFDMPGYTMFESEEFWWWLAGDKMDRGALYLRLFQSSRAAYVQYCNMKNSPSPSSSQPPPPSLSPPPAPTHMSRGPYKGTRTLPT